MFYRLWNCLGNSNVYFPITELPTRKKTSLENVQRSQWRLESLSKSPYQHSFLKFNKNVVVSNNCVDLVVVVYSFQNNFDSSVKRDIRKKKHNIKRNYFMTIRNFLMFDEAHKILTTVYRVLVLLKGNSNFARYFVNC